MSKENLNEKIGWGILINTAYAILELIAGFFTGSLALVSDAAHNIVDSLALIISYIGERVAKRKANLSHTYGYGKFIILTALINSGIMVGLALGIFYIVYRRFINPSPIDGGPIMIIAALGIVVNLAVAFILSKNRDNLNIRTAFLNMAFDVLASVAALASGFAAHYGFYRADALAGAVIGTLMIAACVGIINKAVHILLEGAPENIDPAAIKSSITAFPQIIEINNFHVWMIAAGQPSLSCRIVINESGQNNFFAMVKEIKCMLADKYNINHTTIEPGLEPIDDEH